MNLRCTCIVNGDWKIMVRDPWCAAHGELPVSAGRDGFYHLPEWMSGLQAIVSEETGQLFLLDGTPITR